MTRSDNLPNFIHFGTPKSGSATLSLILRSHPDVYTPRPKELNFFNDSWLYDRGINWYETTYFADCSGQPVRCDNSIGYATGDPEQTLSRITATLGRNIRILLTLRNPVERAYSQYRMARYKGQFERLEFADAVRSALEIDGKYTPDELRCLEERSYHGDERKMAIFRHATYVTPGYGARLLRMCQHAVGADRVLVLFTEDMATDLQASVRILTDFLGVKPIEVDGGLRENQAMTLRFPLLRQIYNRIYALGWVRRVVRGLSDEHRRMLRKRLLSWNYRPNDEVAAVDPEASAMLRSCYEIDIHDLQTRTRRDLSHWLTAEFDRNRINRHPTGEVISTGSSQDAHQL